MPEFTGFYHSLIGLFHCDRYPLITNYGASYKNIKKLFTLLKLYMLLLKCIHLPYISISQTAASWHFP